MFLCLNCNIIKHHNIWRNIHHFRSRQVGWLVVLRINVDLAIFQPYLDLEAGDDQSLKIQVARPGIEPWSSCSASQELNHSATAASQIQTGTIVLHTYISEKKWKHPICTTRINRNNFCIWPEWNICLSAFSQTADLTCNHSHCIWRVYSSAFLLAPMLMTLWVLYQNLLFCTLLTLSL